MKIPGKQHKEEIKNIKQLLVQQMIILKPLSWLRRTMEGVHSNWATEVVRNYITKNICKNVSIEVDELTIRSATAKAFRTSIDRNHY